MTELIHGRASTYNNHKCRCGACRTAWAEYIREGGYVRRYQEKQRQKKLQNNQTSANILSDIEMQVLDLRDPESEKQFLDSLRKYGIPTTNEESN